MYSEGEPKMPKMRRLLDIGTDSPGKVEITTKCPKCNNLVTAVWEPKKE